MTQACIAPETLMKVQLVCNHFEVKSYALDILLAINGVLIDV